MDRPSVNPLATRRLIGLAGRRGDARSSHDPFNGRVAGITGAGSGIGRALALALASEGALLALSDIDVLGLGETARQCSAVGATVRQDVIDVTDRAAMSAYADDVAAQFGRVNLLFNNAGIIFTGDITQSSYDDLERVLDVDFWGVVHGTKAFLPHLIASGAGHLINICSAYGLIAAPSYSAYSAAKFAVRGFTEAIQQEMQATGHPVQVSCVYPGAVRTLILRTSKCADGQDHAAINELFDKVARTAPEQAAATILRGVHAGKGRILVGPDARAADLLARLAGTRYQQLFQLARYLNHRQEESQPRGRKVR